MEERNFSTSGEVAAVKVTMLTVVIILTSMLTCEGGPPVGPALARNSYMESGAGEAQTIVVSNFAERCPGRPLARLYYRPHVTDVTPADG